MRIAIFGASGRTGRRAVTYALAAGHEVSALYVPTDHIDQRPGLDAHVGDALVAAHVAGVIRGADAVVSVLGAPNFRAPGTFMADAMRAIVQGMRAHNVRRVVALANSGVLDAPGGGLVVDEPTFAAEFRPISEAHRGTYTTLQASGLDWTLCCAPTLIEGERTGQVRFAPDVMPEGGAQISVEDTAAFMLAEIGQMRFIQRRVGICW